MFIINLFKLFHNCINILTYLHMQTRIRVLCKLFIQHKKLTIFLRKTEEASLKHFAKLKLNLEQIVKKSISVQTSY